MGGKKPKVVEEEGFEFQAPFNFLESDVAISIEIAKSGLDAVFDCILSEF